MKSTIFITMLVLFTLVARAQSFETKCKLDTFTVNLNTYPIKHLDEAMKDSICLAEKGLEHFWIAQTGYGYFLRARAIRNPQFEVAHYIKTSTLKRRVRKIHMIILK